MKNVRDFSTLFTSLDNFEFSQVTSMVSTQDVINLVMEKYKIESKAENFGLYIVRDNGEQKRLKIDEYPLITRVILGPHEDVAKLFLMDSQQTQEIRWVSFEFGWNFRGNLMVEFLFFPVLR